MSCHCCLKLVKRLFEDNGITVDDMGLGEVTVSFDPEKADLDMIAALLQEDGFELLMDKDKQLIEQIKSAVIDLVHHSTFNAMVRNSDYLVEKFNLSYQYISSIFSKEENITLEKYIILHKIEKAKELIQYGELTLSEIAFMMGYSSVQYLSTQFKTVTGISVSEYKKNPGKYRQVLQD
jgi:AraC-like DNA-binding protein